MLNIRRGRRTGALRLVESQPARERAGITRRGPAQLSPQRPSVRPQVTDPLERLAFALALIDDLTPGELSGGLTVVATGTIAPDGTVGTVGGLRLKTLAARRAGADLLLVPSADLDEAQAFAGPLPVVGVNSLTEAVSALVSRGGQLT